MKVILAVLAEHGHEDAQQQISAMWTDFKTSHSYRRIHDYEFAVPEKCWMRPSVMLWAVLRRSAVGLRGTAS